MPLANCSGINTFVDIYIWSYPNAGNTNAAFSLLFSLIELYVIYENVTYAKHYQKSWNNILASSVYGIKGNLRNIVHFVAK